MPAILLRRDHLARRAFWKPSEDHTRRVAFYAQFVKPGDLVFDIGANIGERSRAFYELGTRVVAIEPQETCAAAITNHFRGRRRFSLVRCAVGDAPGFADMAISPTSTLSSLSKEWIRSVRDSGRMGAAEWTRTVRVPIRTFDSLIEEFGLPDFAKIDVEGFEKQVLEGLSRPVSALSFEFTPEFGAATRAGIAHLCQLAPTEFQISLGESMRFFLPDWVDRSQILASLAKVPPESFGDIYARTRAA